MSKWGIGVATAALAMTFAGGQAQAQGSYIAAGAGWTNLDNADTQIENGVAVGTPIIMTLNTDENYSARGAYGFRMGNLRVEGELGMTQNDIGQYRSTQPTNINRSTNGNISTVTGMLNGYLDFNPGAAFSPFIGVGLGATRADIELSGPRPTTPNAAPETIFDNDATNFGWQAMVGATIPLAGNMALTGQYRYFDAGTVDMPDATGHQGHIDLKGISWDVGLRWNF